MRHRKPLRAWRAAAALAAGLLAPPPAAAAVDAQYAEEQLSLESARYRFEIEGDRAAAYAILNRLKDSPYAGIRTQVRYLRGVFYEEEGRPVEAVRMYAAALGNEGLSDAQKQRLISRLLVLNPEILRPFRDAGRARGLPARIFPTPVGNGIVYVLAEEPENPDRPARLLWQNHEGMLRPLPVTLSADEEVLDALPDRVLTRSLSRQRVYLRRGPGFSAAPLQERFAVESAYLFSGESGEYLLIGSQGLRHMRGAQVLFSHPLPGPGCAYHPASPRARQGVLFCPDQAIFRADFSRRTLSPLPLGGDMPAEIAFSGEYLALRYMDHLEIRRGPAFDAFLWGFPSGLQDPVALGRTHVFLAAGGGPLRAFALRSGQQDWQRDDGVSAVRAEGGELFILTHARNFLAVDEKGNLLYSYEPGWDEEEPLLLPTRDWLVVHQANGSRVRLNRELLRLTGGNRDYLFHGVRGNLRDRNPRGALEELDALLALEPGNGQAWREKARLLATLDAPRAEQTNAWLQAARSQSAAPWTSDPAFGRLAADLGASWVWKRQPGPRFFPALTGGRQFSFYMENDNQTLVVLENRTGAMKSSFRFPEPLDMKVSVWSGDTLIVSSPSRLYLMSPARGSGILAQVPLRSPVCQAILVPQGLLYSDWNGSLHLLDPSARQARWETGLGRSCLLVAPGRSPEHADVFEIEGAYHEVNLRDGKSQGSVRLPPGTVTEVHAGRAHAYAGYNEGLVVAVDRNRPAIAWQRDMGEQIFSMSGRGDQVLLVGTASKRIVHLAGQTGAVQSQAQASTYLFNRPLLAGDGYWVGTTEPALEKRSLSHRLLQKLPLTDMPGTPSLVGSGIAISTLDNFILYFPQR